MQYETVTHSSIERTCLACREKRCCHYYRVSLTGADVWRIARHLQLPWYDYIVYQAMEEREARYFLLQSDGVYYDMWLHHTEYAQEGTPCVFLVSTNDHHAVCGLGSLRPTQCASYPVYEANDVISLINDTEGCVRAWSYGDIDQRERQQVHRMNDELRVYEALVADWNQRITSRQLRFGFDEFYAYLMNEYARREVSS